MGFSCMDSHSDRGDTKSRRELKKIITSTLQRTNWRLKSDGISYRLGYLSGSIKAYENVEDMMTLVNR